MAAKIIFVYFSRHLEFFEKLFSHKICISLILNEYKKEIGKMIKTLGVMQENMTLIRHFESIKGDRLI
jgi:hypothetical protein